jgi:hypothetical protein
MATAIRGLMGEGASLSVVALALVAPAVLTLLLAPVTLCFIEGAEPIDNFDRLIVAILEG